MEDLMEQANEVQESLGRSYNLPDDIDETDLEAGVYSARLVERHPTPFLLGLD
jgi:charged multivesicular body protein 5